mmetsp:Transcript_5883/g.14461  ORF Transcript_5883/g.14461 Transcript_5883/m.14461 type:complete len:563 (+) Transcript_5883:275-1963(+)
MKTTMSLLLMGVIALFAATSMSTTSMTVADAATTGGIHGRIVKENRYVLFNSRQLTGECMEICTMGEVEEPIPVSFNCPVDEEPVVPCVHDTDCIIWPEGVPKIYGSCPKCVKESDSDTYGKCVKPYDGKGNLNCCKRTPGNDLVITNGCGANNVCVGFNDHDQCNVNQHALHCNPCCPGGNVIFDEVTGEVTKENGRVVIDQEICSTLPNTCFNDQGNQHHFPTIYPIEFCLTDKIKWKERKGNPIDLIDSDGTLADLAVEVKAAADNGSLLSEVISTANVLSTDPVVGVGQCDSPAPEPVSECVTADECWAKPENKDWFCPKCVVDDNGIGRCVDVADVDNENALAEFVGGIKGNLNCCKRTPGTEGIITNGCGANNICIGFRENDQCEVNNKAAYCNLYCPGGNVLCQTGEDGTGTPQLCGDESVTDFYMPDGKKRFAVDGSGTIKYNESHLLSPECNLDNRNGADDTGNQKPMPPVFPMSYCKCRDVKWKETGNDPDTMMEMCGPDSDDVEVVFPTDIVATAEVVPSGGCNCGDYAGDKKGCQACSDCTWSNSKKTCT